MGGEFRYKNQDISMKVNSTVMKKEGEAYKFIVTPTFILDSFSIIKNMDTGTSFGSTYLHVIQKVKIIHKTIREIGGEVFLMVRVSIAEIMEINTSVPLRMD